MLVKPVLLETIDRTVRRHAHAVPARAAAARALVDLAEGPLPPDVHALLETSLTQSLAGARDAVANNDTNALRHELHSLRGAFATIHEHAVADAVGELQAIVHGGDMTSFDAQLADAERLARNALQRRATQPPSA